MGINDYEIYHYIFVNINRVNKKHLVKIMFFKLKIIVFYYFFFIYFISIFHLLIPVTLMEYDYSDRRFFCSYNLRTLYYNHYPR